MKYHLVERVRRDMRSLLIASWIALTFVGCVSTRPGSAIPPFRQGVVTAEQQSASTFADINSFIRSQQIERAISRPSLTEDLFFEALASDDLAKWERAFSLIESYAEKLEHLLGGSPRSGVEEELSALGQKIERVTENEIPAGVSAAFTKFGGVLIQMKAEHDAIKAIRKADPALQQVFGSMMEAIGEDRESGIRGTLWVSRTQVLSNIDVEEFRSAEGDVARRKVVQSYVSAMDERDAQDRLLGSLRLNLATLAKTHQELANDRRVSAAALLQIAQDEFQAYRKELSAIRERRSAKDGGGS